MCGVELQGKREDIRSNRGEAETQGGEPKFGGKRGGWESKNAYCVIEAVVTLAFGRVALEVASRAHVPNVSLTTPS